MRPMLSCFQPWVAFSIELFEKNEGGIATTENPVNFGKSKHIDVWWYFIRDFVQMKAITVMHV